MTDIAEMAAQHCESFAAALALRDTKPSATTTEIANAMFDHYMQSGFTSFCHGVKQEIGTRDRFVPGMAKYFDIWVDRGLGLNFRMESYKVRSLGPSAALCILSWKYYPPPNSRHQSWAWESLYIFRVPPGQTEGYWELSIDDNEVSNLLQRYPDFFHSFEQ